jgi:glycosyltransferase involved in cell wall biosynthesis
MAIAACNQLKAPLKVVGSGPEEARLRAMAGDNIQFLGWRGDQELANIYAQARAMLFPGEEDFGITPLEAMASGCPVVAFGKGGALETVLGQDSPTPTGRFFYEQTVQSLVQAIQMLEQDLPHFDAAHMTARAALFDVAVFRENMINFLKSRYL